MRDASARPSLRGKLGYHDDAVSGGDFEADGRSCVFDGHASIALSPSFVKAPRCGSNLRACRC